MMSSVSSFYRLRGMIKQRIKEEEEEDELYLKKRIIDVDDDIDYISGTVVATAELSSNKKRKPRCPDLVRDKLSWDNKYRTN